MDNFVSRPHYTPYSEAVENTFSEAAKMASQSFSRGQIPLITMNNRLVGEIDIRNAKQPRVGNARLLDEIEIDLQPELQKAAQGAYNLHTMTVPKREDATGNIDLSLMGPALLP